MKPSDLQLAVAIAERLPGDRKHRVFKELADRVKDATISYAFKAEAQREAVQELERLAGERDGTALGEALATIARRIEELREDEDAEP